MSLPDLLLGGSLVALGALTQAVADRIRGLHAARTVTRDVIAVPPAVARGAPAAVPTGSAKAMAADVVAALVASGYKKAIAAEAAEGCTPAERATIEAWTRAALRRCAQGAA